MKSNKITSSRLEEIEGTIQGHRDGYGFVIRSDGDDDILLQATEMRAAMHGDRVKVHIVGQDKRGRPVGSVLEIIERPVKTIIGRLLHESVSWVVAPEDRRYSQDILIPKTALGAAREGQVVVVELTEPPALYGQPVGRVIEVLGEVDDPGLEIEIPVRKFDIPHEFSAKALEQSKELPDVVRAADKRARVDLTDISLVTIDGEDARDFDDAVYCQPAVVTGRGKKPNGWRLLVAIADVSHYVQTDGAIDVDAYERATSVYFPRRVIPMLPEKLSNGLCSLNPDVERLCMVCDMMITEAGEIHAYQFYPAVMLSHARLTYTEVADILTNTRGPAAAQRSERVQDLVNLHDLYRALLKAREKRGALNLELVETQIISDESGRILRIEPRVRNDAHRLIEECMLAANVCAAEFVIQNKQPCLYRVHEGPTFEKQMMLEEYLDELDIGLSLSDKPTPAEFERIAQATRDRPDAIQIHTMLLRSMSQAVYTPFNNGHFGLNYQAYTHFTSPIRRYPDLLVHRVIKAILTDSKYQLPAPPALEPSREYERLRKRLQKNKDSDSDDNAPAKLTADIRDWEAAGLHCSVSERRADEASRDVEAWLKCRFMRERLGEEYTGKVSTVTNFGLFVTLDELYVEGLIHISEIGDEYYYFDPVLMELSGEDTGITYKVGTRVRIQVIRVDLDGRRIDFRLVHKIKNKSKSSVSSAPKATVPKPVVAKKKEVAKDTKTAAHGKKKSAAKRAR